MSKVKVLEGFEPKITMTYDVMTRIKAIVDICDTEVGFVGLVQKSGNNTYNIYDVFIPEQEAHGATCEIAPGALLDIGHALLEGVDGVEKANQLRYWGHSHNTMSTHPSGQDNKQALEFLQDADYLIRHIVNKKGEHDLTFYDFKSGFEYSDLELTIINPQEVDEYLLKINTITKKYEDDAKAYAKEMVNNVSMIKYKSFAKENVHMPYNYNKQNKDYIKRYKDYYNCFDIPEENVFWNREDVLTTFTDDEILAIATCNTVFEVMNIVEASFSTSYNDAKELYEVCIDLVNEGVVDNYEI